MINNSWDVDGKSKNVADTVGLMVYEGAGVTLVHTLPILVWIWTNAKVTNMKIQQGNDCFITLFQSLDYVKNYAEATSQWEGFPIRVRMVLNIHSTISI